MRKIQILGAAFFAVLAFGVVTAVTASAHTLPTWLKGGVEITKQELAITEGKWLLLGLAFFGAIKLHVICNGKLIGWVGPGSEDLVTEVVGLKAGEKLLISCEVLSGESGNCETNSSIGRLVLVEALHLPWKTRLLEPKAGEIVDHFESDGFGEPQFHVFCLLESGKWTVELCEGVVLSDPLKNDENGTVLGTVTEQLSKHCNTAGVVSHVYGEGTTKLALVSESLAVS